MPSETSLDAYKILVVTYFHPPLESVTVIRNAGLMSEFNKIFKKTIVLTSSNIHFVPEFKNFVAKYSLIKIPTLDFRTLIFLLNSKNPNSQITHEAKQRALVKIFQKLKSSFPFSIALSEGSFFYIIFALFKALRIIKRNKITHLFTSFYPLCDIYVGFLIKLFYPKIIWVCDFRDLPVDPYFKNTFFPKFQDRVLKFMLKRAIKLTTVSNGLKNHLLKYNPTVEVVRNGIDFALFNFERQPFEKFTIGYTGSIYGYDATLSFFSKIIQNLKEQELISEENFKIVYAGKESETLKRFLKEQGVDSFLDSKGQVNREQALEIQRNAHLNLIFSYTLPNFFGVLTGKLFEYLAAQNPILVLIDGVPDSDFENILTEFNAGKVFYSDKDLEIASNWIASLVTGWKKNGVVVTKVDSEKIKMMQWNDAAQQIFRNVSN